ncbi:MAG: hypothetical protein ACI3XI_06815 [Eubacteriales bacterium]
MSKNIYIVVSQTGTILSRILRVITHAEYCHASISLDERLEEMYSFGRVNPYNPFWGGYVRESPDYGTFRRFKHSRCVLLKFTVDDEKYEQIKRRLEDMYTHKDEYGYNYIGLCLAAFKKNHTTPHRFYCSEFVHYIFSEYLIYDKSALPKIVQPIDFYRTFGDRTVYKGMISDFKKA